MIQCLLEGHQFEFNRHLHGDEIVKHHYMKEEYRCTRCGKLAYKEGTISDGERATTREYNCTIMQLVLTHCSNQIYKTKEVPLTTRMKRIFIDKKAPYGYLIYMPYSKGIEYYPIPIYLSDSYEALDFPDIDVSSNHCILETDQVADYLLEDIEFNVNNRISSTKRKAYRNGYRDGWLAHIKKMINRR